MMVETILSVLCQWINSLGYKAIQAPSNNPAPSGRYISVNLSNTRQIGERIVPGPVRGNQVKFKDYIKVAQVQLYEVEGNGDWLRDIQNKLQEPEFDIFVNAHTTSTQTQDNGFTIAELGEIVDNGIQDGTFYIQQKTMAIDINFMDHAVHTTPRMESVSGTINNQPFHAEVNNG